MTGTWQDFRFAFRLLRKNPVLTAVAIVSLALGIGATAAAFSIIDALLLRPLPAVATPERLVAVRSTQAGQPQGLGRLSWADYLDYAGNGDLISGLAATGPCDLTLNGRGGPAERVSGLAVSANYFEVLGLKPALGRLFSSRDGAEPGVVLAHGLWRRRFGADSKVLGSSILINGKSLTVVGIAPAGFWGTDLITRQEIWLPLDNYSNVATGVLVPFSGKHNRKQQWLDVVGRLAPGARLEAAQSKFNLLASRLAAAYPEINKGRGVRLVPITELILGQGMRPRLVSFTRRLALVVAVVLAIATINLTGLLLTRALDRQREIAVRLSLGASGWRLVRQLSIEALVLSLIGAVMGIGLASAALPFAERIKLPTYVSVLELGLSIRVVVFTLIVSLSTCLVFTLVPALQVLRKAILPATRRHLAVGRHLRFGLRELLVPAQIAIALLVLIASGLMLRTIANLDAINPGFDPSRVLVFSVDTASEGYDGPRVSIFYRNLIERLRRQPGVKDVSMAAGLPIMGGSVDVDLSVEPEEPPAVPGPASTSPPSARHVLVGNHYFRVTGIPFVKGRDFGPEDEHSSLGSVIVNETTARRLWPGRSPVGHRLRLVESKTPFEVVGLVADAAYESPKAGAEPIIYLAHSQSDKSFIGTLLAPEMNVLVRTVGKPLQALGAARDTVRALDARLPVYKVTTLEELLASTVGAEHKAAMLYSALAAVSLALALLGLYGVLAQIVVERKREIGIRVACGATPVMVQTLVIRRSAVLALSGLAVGLAISELARQLVVGMLFGVGARDLGTWLSAVLAVGAVSAAVTALPARRAARLHPADALRIE